MRETETLVKTRDYLEIFSVFKEIPDAQALEGIVNVFGGKGLTNFEKSAIGMSVSFVVYLGRERGERGERVEGALAVSVG